MAKVKTAFFCKNCGAKESKWLGKCNSCNEWNSFVEEILENPKDKIKKAYSANRQEIARPISQIQSDAEERIILLNEELNRTLGGGLVKGSVVLMGGEPGIGKSTLMLQVALQETKIKT